MHLLLDWELLHNYQLFTLSNLDVWLFIHILHTIVQSVTHMIIRLSRWYQFIVMYINVGQLKGQNN